MQAINFYMLAAAILSAGYVSALTNRLYVVAGAIGMIGITISILAFLAIRRLRKTGLAADEPMAALQDRLAADLGVESLRMIASLRRASAPTPKWRADNVTVYVILSTAAVIFGIGATLYSWLGH
jgi:hypothetical protein